MLRYIRKKTSTALLSTKIDIFRIYHGAAGVSVATIFTVLITLHLSLPMKICISSFVIFDKGNSRDQMNNVTLVNLLCEYRSKRDVLPIVTVTG